MLERNASLPNFTVGEGQGILLLFSEQMLKHFVLPDFQQFVHEYQWGMYWATTCDPAAIGDWCDAVSAEMNWPSIKWGPEENRYADHSQLKLQKISEEQIKASLMRLLQELHDNHGFDQLSEPLTLLKNWLAGQQQQLPLSEYWDRAVQMITVKKVITFDWDEEENIWLGIDSRSARSRGYIRFDDD